MRKGFFGKKSTSKNVSTENPYKEKEDIQDMYKHMKRIHESNASVVQGGSAYVYHPRSPSSIPSSGDSFLSAV